MCQAVCCLFNGRCFSARSGFWFQVSVSISDFGFGVGFRFRLRKWVSDLRFRVLGFEFWVLNFGFPVSSFIFRGFMFSGLCVFRDRVMSVLDQVGMLAVRIPGRI